MKLNIDELDDDIWDQIIGSAFSDGGFPTVADVAEVLDAIGVEYDDEDINDILDTLQELIEANDIADGDTGGNEITKETFIDSDGDGDADVTITEQDDGTDDDIEDEPHDADIGLAGETTPEEELMLKMAAGGGSSDSLSGETTPEEELMLKLMRRRNGAVEDFVPETDEEREMLDYVNSLTLSDGGWKQKLEDFSKKARDSRVKNHHDNWGKTDTQKKKEKENEKKKEDGNYTNEIAKNLSGRRW